MCEDLANPSQRGGHEENAATFPRAGNLGQRASEPPIEEGCRGHDVRKLFLEVPEEVNAGKNLSSRLEVSELLVLLGPVRQGPGSWPQEPLGPQADSFFLF